MILEGVEGKSKRANAGHRRGSIKNGKEEVPGEGEYEEQEKGKGSKQDKVS